MGGAFFGESMVSLKADASKAALYHLVRRLGGLGYGLIDCQVRTEHLVRMGAREIPRREFLALLEDALIKRPEPPGRWGA
jgi:leucyl/phenylalanyl-tRNA--protein transferase